MFSGSCFSFSPRPNKINDQIGVMRGTVLSGVVIPLHSHADPEIFYVLNGSLEVFQAEGPSAGWQTVNAAEFVSIPGNIRHAVRNTSPSPLMTSIIVTKQELYSFFRELARAIRSEQASRTANSGGDAAVLQRQQRRGIPNSGLHPLYRECAAIGISLR